MRALPVKQLWRKSRTFFGPTLSHTHKKKKKKKKITYNSIVCSLSDWQKMIPVSIRPTHQSSLSSASTILQLKAYFQAMYTGSLSTNTIFHQRCPATKHAIADNKPNTLQLNLAHVSQPTFFFLHQHLFWLYFIYTQLINTEFKKKKKFLHQ